MLPCPAISKIIALQYIVGIKKEIRLRHSLRKYFIIRVWEATDKQGRYILPLHNYFCQNETIQIKDGSQYCEIIFQDLSAPGDPVIDFRKYNTVP